MLHVATGLSLPLKAVTQTFAILAMRGVGKTYTASVLAEEFSKASLPFAVLDPTGAWWGLRAGADGKSAGYPVTILGGDHGDVPLEEAAGKVIAALLAEEAPQLVIDLSLFSKSAMRRFVADFAEELYRKNRNPLHLIMDTHEFRADQVSRFPIGSSARRAAGPRYQPVIYAVQLEKLIRRHGSVTIEEAAGGGYIASFGDSPGTAQDTIGAAIHDAAEACEMEREEHTG